MARSGNSSSPFFPRLILQLLQDGVNARDGDSLELGLDLGVGDLSVVDDGSPAAVAVPRSRPADLVGQLGLEVASEDDESVVVVCAADVDLLPARHDEGIVWSDDDKLVDALLLYEEVSVVNAVAEGLGADWHGYDLLKSAMCSMKRGTWLALQVGVKAPGTETRTTFLLANSLSVL